MIYEPKDKEYSKAGRKRDKGKPIILLVMLLFHLFTAAGCTTYDNFSEAFLSQGAGEETVRIGIFQPLSGSDEEGGRLEVTGIELAHKLYPKVLGKEVELVYADNKSKIRMAETAAKQLIDKKVDIVLGSYGNTLSLSGGEYFHQAMIPAIAITCTNPLVTKGNPYYFRVSIVDSFQGVMAAKYVLNELGISKAVILKKSEDDYGSALSQQFADKLSSLTGEDAILATVEYKEGATDYEEQLLRIKALRAEAVYLPCSAAEGAEIIRQAKEQGVDTLFIGTDLWHQETFLETGGSAAEGVVFTTYFDAEAQVTERTEEFLSAYRAEYGDGEMPDSAVALGFDAYLVALDAMERQAEQIKLAEQDPEAGKEVSLRDVLAATREYMGATGSITFDENGDSIKSVVIITVEDGKFQHIYTVEPEWNSTK